MQLPALEMKKETGVFFFSLFLWMPRQRGNDSMNGERDRQRERYIYIYSCVCVCVCFCICVCVYTHEVSRNPASGTRQSPCQLKLGQGTPALSQNPNNSRFPKGDAFSRTRHYAPLRFRETQNPTRRLTELHQYSVVHYVIVFV